MEKAVDVSIRLPKPQAKALLEQLRRQYRLQLQELWWAEEFSRIPEGLRHGSIIAARPAMAAQKATLGALQTALTLNAAR
ncbi:MAG: hypothetical protein NDI93_01425 [Pseudomonas sp.]|nr:hypothetical protein [Pseudomonas sp.]